MLEWRTVPSSSAMMDSVTCVVTHVLRSCRSHARVTSCTDLTPSGWPSHRWHRPCLVQRSGGWRLTFTTKMVGTKIIFHACDSHICVCEFGECVFTLECWRYWDYISVYQKTNEKKNAGCDLSRYRLASVSACMMEYIILLIRKSVSPRWLL